MRFVNVDDKTGMSLASLLFSLTCHIVRDAYWVESGGKRGGRLLLDPGLAENRSRRCTIVFCAQ